MPKITIGRWVHYVLTQEDVEAIVSTRAGTLINQGPGPLAPGRRPAYQALVGHLPLVEAHVPMVVVALRPVVEGIPPRVGGQCFLDGNDRMWVVSAQEDSKNGAPGTWHWPEGTPEFIAAQEL